MMKNIKCFIIVPTNLTFQWLRRYSFESVCPITGDIHDTRIQIEDGLTDQNGNIFETKIEKYLEQFPCKCDCGYTYKETDGKHILINQKYIDNQGNNYTTQEAPIGAMWESEHFALMGRVGNDGKSWIVQTPGGEWAIDSRASNCTMPNDNNHRCWCRHGEAPNFTVNKEGNTCNAGGGSIEIGIGKPYYYHGFLINGELTNCP